MTSLCSSSLCQRWGLEFKRISRPHLGQWSASIAQPCSMPAIQLHLGDDCGRSEGPGPEEGSYGRPDAVRWYQKRLAPAVQPIFCLTLDESGRLAVSALPGAE